MQPSSPFSTIYSKIKLISLNVCKAINREHYLQNPSEKFPHNTQLMKTTKKEIFIVEDSADYRQLIRAIFEQFLPDYPIRFFQGGSELYQYMILQSSPEFAGRRPGLIIMDLQLPAIHGVDMIGLIRQTPPNESTDWKNIPIIVLSNVSAGSEIQRCYQTGINSFFTKPIEFDELKNLFTTICKYWIDYNVLPSANLATPGGVRNQSLM